MIKQSILVADAGNMAQSAVPRAAINQSLVAANAKNMAQSAAWRAAINQNQPDLVANAGQIVIGHGILAGSSLLNCRYSLN